ncbi:hypothetical protein J6590_069820 [Homalodisca vitripennis]|nr:hypothetical protein J6590_069820 [Homalodisca vitripennis]
MASINSVNHALAGRITANYVGITPCHPLQHLIHTEPLISLIYLASGSEHEKLSVSQSESTDGSARGRNSNVNVFIVFIHPAVAATNNGGSFTAMQFEIFTQYEIETDLMNTVAATNNGGSFTAMLFGVLVIASLRLCFSSRLFVCKEEL